MKYWLAILFCMLPAALLAQQGAENATVHFRAVDIYVDSGSKPLAAYQMEFSVTNVLTKIVGIEGGQPPAFREPPFYDPKAMQQERVIIAAFSTDKAESLPQGKTRVATIHIETIGIEEPKFALKLEAVADADGNKISGDGDLQGKDSMKAISKNWVWCAIVIAAMLGGCAGIPKMKEPQTVFNFSDFYTTTNSRPMNWYSQSTRSISGSSDELWVVPRNSEGVVSPETVPGAGALLAKVRDGETPLLLNHTDVKASLAGCIGTVEVKQEFENPYSTKIEAVYVFPLPPNAAIDEFVMTIGKRRIRGIIRERKDAEEIYKEAKRQGYRASLLTEERPNIFRQSVANIEPGNEIDVNIQYFQTLDYRDGWFEFVFPMVVTRQSNAPAYLKSGEHSGEDVSLRVDVDAGAPILELESKTHAITKTILSPGHIVAQLKRQDSMPNRDFVLRYRLADGQIQSSLLTHRDERGRFFQFDAFSTKGGGEPDAGASADEYQNQLGRDGSIRSHSRQCAGFDFGTARDFDGEIQRRNKCTDSCHGEFRRNAGAV